MDRTSDTCRAAILTTRYGKAARNRSGELTVSTAEGARAALECFYYAFNQRDIDVFDAVWARDDLDQLNNPLGGILRGHADIRGLYRRIFEGPVRVWVEFHDIAEYAGAQTVVFAGRERGEFCRLSDRLTIALNIRTTRVFQWRQGRWAQVHHHGSIDDATLLARYQEAVAG
jgi:limonene-1,2-epoxide hydrolase